MDFLGNLKLIINMFALNFVLTFGVTKTMSASAQVENTARYIITETGPNSSFDPLNADQTQNLPVMRMLYLTPLEVSDDDKLRSTVLSEFSYQRESRTIAFEVRRGLSYSNGDALTVEDVVLAIKRMAFARPLFPVLREIQGLDDWKKQPAPLLTNPSGIKVRNNRIEIQLSEDIDHPLFRFTLELFSIIPKSCIDLNSGKLNCQIPPFSGPYELSENKLSADNRRSFRRRVSLADVFFKDIPKEILFEYLPPESLLKKGIHGRNWVAAGSERLYLPEEMKQIRSDFAFNGLVKNRFSFALLNPNIPPFDRPECRMFFADRLRRSLVAAGLPIQSVEGGISPKIISGYQSVEDLKAFQGTLKKDVEEKCLQAFQNSAIRWSFTKNVTPKLEGLALRQLFKDLKVREIEPLVFENREAGFDAFSSAQTAVHLGSTGLWALDPFGDLQMLFTPNLHKTLMFCSKDQPMQDLIARLRRADSPEHRKALALELNRHIFKNALFNVYSHSRRFFVADKSSSLAKIPMAISGAAPWQVFSGL